MYEWRLLSKLVVCKSKTTLISKVIECVYIYIFVKGVHDEDCLCMHFLTFRCIYMTRQYIYKSYRAIVDEILWNKKARIQDPLALLDSKESLQRMLADFIHDTNPTMPLDQQQQLVRLYIYIYIIILRTTYVLRRLEWNHNV
jgi:hypothetical protein